MNALATTKSKSVENPDGGEDDLISRIHALPRELFDEIYDSVTTTSAREVRMTKSYEPPVLLQYNRNAREQCARSYYRNATFFFDVDMEAHYFFLWLMSLPPEHVRMLRDVRFVDRDIPGLTDQAGEMLRCTHAEHTKWVIHGHLRDSGVDIFWPTLNVPNAY